MENHIKQLGLLVQTIAQLIQISKIRHILDYLPSNNVCYADSNDLKKAQSIKPAKRI